ncbi:MAG: type II toxin-antitoxin system HicB family antitoxin [Acidimicrobiaceae bacterium]|nr:type II toxin-antitoxin system HicB family antitoxin [Acidimicrobiaceae bacterium]
MSDTMATRTLTYTVILERTGTGYSAYAPDLPGCISVGGTREEIMEMMREAMEFHLESMVEDGDEIPELISSAVEIEVRVS